MPETGDHIIEQVLCERNRAHTVAVVRLRLLGRGLVVAVFLIF